VNKQTIKERFEARAVMPPTDRADLLGDVERELAGTAAAIADARGRLDDCRREAQLAEHQIDSDGEYQRELRAIAASLYAEEYQQ
jgi:hypothetical protein